MFSPEAQEPDHLDVEPEEWTGPPPPCAQGHSSTLSLPTHEGGAICLLCLSNLISNPRSPTLHVSYALSQLSHALSQPQFLQCLLSSHPHFLLSPLLHAISCFDDDPIAHQLINLISLLSAHSSDICAEFVAKLAGLLSSGSLAWSRRQLYVLHCFGVILNSQITDLYVHIKDKDCLVSNLVAGLQLPSEEIRGEILFVLYKLCALQYMTNDGDHGADFLLEFCPKLLQLSLEALMKTHCDDVRLNCIALLTILVKQGLFSNVYANDISSMSSNEEDNFMQSTEDEALGPSMNLLFAEAIKGPLLSTDSQVQISTLDLLFHYLSRESASIKQIKVLVEENVADYVFEILRLSDCKDPVVNCSIRVLDLFSRAEAFKPRLVVGFAALMPILHYVAELPFHPVQTETLKLVWSCISDYPGIASASHVQEIVLGLTRMLKKYSDGEMGLLPEAFLACCSIFVSLLKIPSFYEKTDLVMSVQEASRNAILACLNAPEKDPNQLLYALCLLREVYACSRVEEFLANSGTVALGKYILDVCASHLLPWFLTAINEMNEETILGVLETFHHVLLQDSDTQAKKFANILASASWFSFSFGCLGSFSTEKMKWRVYLILSSLADVLLENNSGQPIRDAASCLPSDPIDLLFLLGQKNSDNLELSSCQSAVLMILHTSSLYGDRLADDKSVLASLEQYIHLNSTDLICRESDSSTTSCLVNLYGLYRSLGNTSYQIPYSPEVERILFHLLSENEWDLASAVMHPISLQWLFQQEKLIKPLSYQILKFCQNNSSNRNHMIIYGNESQRIDVQMISELVAAGDNYAATSLVCLFMQLVQEEGQEYDIILALNLISSTIFILPAASDQLCSHEIANAIRNLSYSSIYSSSQQIFTAILPLIFNILCSASPEALSNDESWVAVTVKLIDNLVTRGSVNGWSHEGLLVIGILGLILYRSTNNSLVEASRSIVLNSSLVSAINSNINAACSKGPALIQYDEGTSMGKNLTFMLLLYYFLLKSLPIVLPGAMDWQSFFDPSNKVQQLLSTINVSCHELCRLMTFGPPLIKLVTSYCLLELITRLSEQIDIKHEELKCPVAYLESVMAVLEGLVFYTDTRVAMNCAICLSKILGWEKLVVQGSKNNWCRLIVEEMAISLGIPCLASNSYSNHNKPAVHVTVALLKLQNSPGWMRTVFDDPSITGIIENLATTNISAETVLLFRELLNSEFLNAEQIAGLNHLLQACRKRIYTNSTQAERTNELHVPRICCSPDDLGQVCESLIHLMSSVSPLDTNSDYENRTLLDEIELFFRTLTVEDGS